MTPEERRKRIRALMAGLDPSEVEALIAGLRNDVAEEQQRIATVGSLLEERRNYERRGEDERVLQVNEQLAHYGHVPESTGARAKGAT